MKKLECSKRVLKRRLGRTEASVEGEKARFWSAESTLTLRKYSIKESDCPAKEKFYLRSGGTGNVKEDASANSEGMRCEIVMLVKFRVRYVVGGLSDCKRHL